MGLKPTRRSSRCLTIKKVMCYMLLLIILGYSPFLMYDLYVNSVEIEFYNLHMENINSASDLECIIPNYDPYDPHVKKFLSSSKIIVCGQPQPYLTYLDYDGFIHFNKTTFKHTGYNESDLNCVYNEIFRRNETDNDIILGVPQIFTETEKIRSSAFILVKCLSRSGEIMYESGHAYVPPLPQKLLKHSKRQDDGDVSQPSVLIFGLDSMSRLNFIRQLPRTYNFLTNVLNSVIFKGLTKTGDNTFPNMMALLSGKNVHKRNKKSNTLSVNRPKFFDSIPLVWDSFKANGYTTMYSEDVPDLTIFNFHASGFKYQPTGYYLRPFWLALDRIKNFKSKDSRCFGNIPKHLYLTNYVEQFLKRMKNHRYFAFAFLTQLSHDDLNEIQVADSDFEKMFLRMWQNGLLNNTIVMVLGDHGNRFSKFRTTDIGRVEERMPFLSVSLPEVFQQTFPHLMAGLQRNSDNLLSWFDFYEMLMDIANNNLNKRSVVQRYGTIGNSPFRWVPRNRTCDQAGIPEEYCICARETQISTSDPRVKDVAQDLMTYINVDLLGNNIKQGLCSPLNLTKILSAQLLSLGPSVAKPQGFRVLYRVQVQVMPSNGLFEATLERDAWSKTAHVVGDVNRINRYGNQSHCITDRILRLYCFCTNLVL